MSALDVIAFVWALVLIVPCACRMDPLRYWRHKLLPIVFHQSMWIVCLGAAFSAWQGLTGVLELAALTCVTIWMVWSYQEWRDGVPVEEELEPKEPPARRATDRLAGAMRNGNHRMDG